MKRKAKCIMVLGTGSDVGKSLVVTAICRILRNMGIRVAPFKAQNMSNNSYVTLEGGEIGRAQVVQAESAGLLPSVHMNPILLKPSGAQSAQVVVTGRVKFQYSAREYHLHKEDLKQVVMNSYDRLSSMYDVIVIEGAGSCCEMNLKDNDFVNFWMAQYAGAHCILVADIDRGGVFAQIIGSYHLMSRKEKALIMGFLINKFRGDPELFHSGMKYIEKKTARPILGLVPYYQDIRIDTEDSVAIQKDQRVFQIPRSDTINIGVLHLPAISNFTDFEILEHESHVVLNYLSTPEQLTDDYDLLILPGTKNVMEDGLWLAKRGWKRAILKFKNTNGHIIGICGGYQLLGQIIHDPHGVESDKNSVKGVGLLPIETTLAQEKIVRKVTGYAFLWESPIRGYEIHMGRSLPVKNKGKAFSRIHEPGKRIWWEDGWMSDDGRIMGTYVHGIFDSPSFRDKFLNGIRRNKGLKLRRPRSGRLARFKHYDRLADHFEKHVNIDRILDLVGLR